MSVQYTLLGFLAEESNYGYELKKKYDGYFGKDKPILTGQIYSTLARLKRDNKVKEIADTSESGGPDRVRYEITDEGKQDFDFLPTGRLHWDQRQAHIQRMRELTAQRRDSSLSDVLLIDHALYHLEADLRWIELTISRLTRLKEEILHEQTNN